MLFLRLDYCLNINNGDKILIGILLIFIKKIFLLSSGGFLGSGSWLDNADQAHNP